MKRIFITLLLLILIKYSYSQINELNFNFQRINFSAAPRTAISPMSIKLWDSYNNGGPTSYGTVLELYGLSGHQTSQLNFGGWDNSKIRYREAFYNQNTWSDWITLLDSKNDVESLGNLRIFGAGAHYILSGNVGIGTTSPQHKLDINGDTQFNGMFGYELSDIFTYKSTTVPHYGFRWNQDDWYLGGRTMLLSSYGGFKLFTSGAPHFFITANGNVGIKTENPKYELDVLGTIRAKEVLVNLDGGADFVFEKDYKLPTIEHVAAYVQANKHLPDIPSANEMEKNGVSMGDMQVKLLQKVEELTLYAIQENNSKKELEKKYNALLEKVEMLTKQIEKK